MSDRIHATKVPMVEMDFDGKTYKFVYNLLAMNRISEMANEGRLPDTNDLWNYDHIRCLVEATGYTHHPDEDWDDLLGDVAGGDLMALSLQLTQMIHEENEKAMGGDPGDSGEAPTEPTPEPVKRRRKASTG